jgi:NAD(P)-dependent dehydrogenase (short-subunit alcohol dehydrogenase family)
MHADAMRLARGEVELGASKNARSGLRAYASSKLCNVLTARALALSPFAKEKRLRVIAYTPGFTPGTQLTRNQSVAFKLVSGLVVPILNLFQRTNTVDGGGSLLADLTLGSIVAPDGQIYASQVKRRLTWPDVSELASDDEVVEKLWLDSAMLVGLAETVKASRAPSDSASVENLR